MAQKVSGLAEDALREGEVMSTASRHKSRQWLKSLARYLDDLRGRLRKGSLSEDSAARVAIEIDALLDLRKQAADAENATRGGGSKLEYDEELVAALARSCNGSKAPW